MSVKDWVLQYCTLQLAIAGSGVLPLPSVYAKCGILNGIVLCGLVALLNDQTTTWLIEAATYNGRSAGSYSELLRRCGFGRGAEVAAEVATFALLFGSLAACLAAAGEASAKLGAACGLGVSAVAWTRTLSPLVACAVVSCFI